MARARNIKPGFFRNEELAELDPLARLLFAGLWTIADRDGRLEDRPKRIKADVLPYDSCDIESLLGALASRSFIARYKHQSARYIQIVNFARHQTPHKNEAASEIPGPEHADPRPPQDQVAGSPEAPKKPETTGDQENSGTSTVQAPESSDTNPALTLNTDSLIPEEVPNGTRLAPVPDPPGPDDQSDQPKPRTSRQQASDVKHERRVELYAAWCRGIGLDPESDEAEVGRKVAYNHLKPITDTDTPTPEDFEACTRFLGSEDWRNTPPTIPDVMRKYGPWAAAGRPETAKPRSPGSRASPAQDQASRNREAAVGAKRRLGIVPAGEVIEANGRVSG